ncbi:MAG TPA: hypothetical protein VGR93_07300 [Candidatus Acidoferrales bacterium]|nr:hypothetical protein [Candidatus Acidoferrales bacterium]
MKRKEYTLLLAISFAAVLIHGYHPFAEDAEIYVPGIVKILHPSYYPFGQEFFETHAHLTLFPNLVAAIVKITHLPLDWTLFLCHLTSIFLLLLACWRIAAKSFATSAGRWAAVAMVASLLTLPVAGTALYIFDQYLNPRSLSIFSVLFAIDAMAEKKYLRMALWLAFTAVIHPLMTLFGIAFIVLIPITKKLPATAAPIGTAAVFLIMPFKSPSPVYWQCLNDHSYYFLLRWRWYEWLGIVAPLLLLWWFGRMAHRRNQQNLELLSDTSTIFGLVFFLAALIVTIPRALALLAVYQPLRSLQLVYVFLLLFAGGLLGESLLKARPLRWLLLLLPICGGMLFAQLQLFPGNRHVEWPGAPPENQWLQAFAWIRNNTPTNAVFALDPHFMALPGEDYQGFRAAAERSRLADANKDWSAAVLYPWLPLANDVFAQTQAARGWQNLGPAEFLRLKQTYGVTWVVLQKSIDVALPCPYQNSLVRICRIE